MPLREYVKKRDFKKTMEPAPAKKKTSKKKTGPLMFVVQEHHASHLHYDFRLELNGVLKSWAVPKGPSLDPKVKRLAVEVEDHPLAYGSFEGVIPKGQYGAGKVFIWDTGVWEPIGNPHAGLKKGHIEFKLKGKKLHGQWMLIRTQRPSGNKPQWLLMKRTDEYVVPEKMVSAKVAKSEAHAIAETERVKRLPKFISPQLAQLVSDPPQGGQWIHETKFDGYRTQAHIEKEKVTLYTRRGLDWTEKYPTISEALENLPVRNAIIDGEIVWLEKNGKTDFQSLQNALKDNRSSRLVYYAFDLLFLDGKDCRSLPLIERKELLQDLVQSLKSPIIRFSEHMEGQAQKLLKAACDYGMEGIISKDADSKYTSTRSPAWAKTKCHQQQEFVIGGFAPGKGARSDFGALLLGVYEGSKLKYVGKTGTGFTQKSIEEVRKKLEAREVKQSPFDINSPKEKGAHWVKPGLVAEITFANWTEDERLRVAVFHGLREDKPAKEVHIEKALKPFGGSKKKTERTKNKIVASYDGLTHPDRILYPKEKITKLQVAQYYQDFAHLMLPHIANRPLALLRCPDGVTKHCFFQKHLTGAIPSDVTPVTITEKSGTKSYSTIDSKEGLLSLTQIRVSEFHAWGCHRDNIEHPDQIVMDFDPGPGVPWKKVMDAAFEMKEILEQLKLKSFVKVTGGKGLHVHIPIAAIYSWDQIKNFTKALAQEMTTRNPELYVVTMSKKIRDKKIFVDYLRNGRGATAIVPYSLRAHEISSVAMPISWLELKKIKSPDQFTLKKTYEYLKKRKVDPWKDYFKKAQKIPILKQAVAS